MDRTGFDMDFGGESEEAAQRDRDRLARETADRQNREQAARAKADADRAAAELAAIERRVRANFVGTDAEYEAEKADLIRQERHRMMQERDAAARMALQTRYQ